MKIFKIVVMGCISAMSQMPAMAQSTMPVNDASTAALVEVCKNTNDQDAQNFCFGFGEGVYQAHLANQSAQSKQSICFTQTGDTREMVLQKFLKWNQSNPQFNQERAAKTLMRFFNQTYSCK